MARVYRRKRPDGSTYRHYYCEYWTPTGWARDISTRCTSKRAAEAEAKRLEEEAQGLARGEESGGSRTVVEAFVDMLDAYEKKVKAGDMSPLTLESYEVRMNMLVRQLGPQTELANLNRDRIELWEHDERIRTSAHNATKNRNVFRSMLRRERQAGRYPFAMDEVFSTGWKRNYTPRSRWLPHEEAFALWLAMHSRRAPHRAARMALSYAVASSPSETDVITRAGIDLRDGLVHIPGTKNEKRDRVVPIVADARPWVMQAVYYLDEHGRFPRYSRHNRARDIKNACAKAGIEPATWVDLRRSRCKLLRLAGVRREHAAAFMGHASEKMVEQVYGKLTGKELKERMEDETV